MAAPARLTTKLSTKGQVILPKSVRDSHNWSPGTELVVEDVAGGVLLRPAQLFEPRASSEVFGILKGPGPALSVEEMDKAVAAEARRRARD